MNPKIEKFFIEIKNFFVKFFPFALISFKNAMQTTSAPPVPRDHQAKLDRMECPANLVNLANPVVTEPRRSIRIVKVAGNAPLGHLDLLEIPEPRVQLDQKDPQDHQRPAAEVEENQDQQVKFYVKN